MVLDKWGTPLRNDRDAAAGICLNLAPVSILRKLIEIFQFEKIERDTVCNWSIFQERCETDVSKFSRLLSWLSPWAIGIILVCYWTWRLLNEMGKFDIFNIITNQHKLQTSQTLKVWNSTNFKEIFSIIFINDEDIDWPRITMFPCQCINQIIIVVILSVYRALLNLIDQWSMTTLLTQKSFLFTHQAMHRVDKNPSCGIFFLEVKIMKQTLLSSMSSLFSEQCSPSSSTFNHPLAILGHSGYPVMLSLAILGYPRLSWVIRPLQCIHRISSPRSPSAAIDYFTQ